VKRLPYCQFRSRVRASDSRHHPAAGGNINNIRHGRQPSVLLQDQVRQVCAAGYVAQQPGPLAPPRRCRTGLSLPIRNDDLEVRFSGSVKPHQACAFCLTGGARGSRPRDLLNAIQALSQLSYGPIRVRRRSGRAASRLYKVIPSNLITSRGRDQKAHRRISPRVR
jgi:hypothetical protein